MSADPVKAKELFLQALKRPATAERDAFLKDECGEDAALRQQVDILIEAHEQAGSFLENGVLVALNKQGRSEEAETLYRELLDVRRRVLGSEHPDTLKTTHNLAVLYTNRSWTLATTSEVSERNPAKAVEFASLAVGLAPDDANHWSNLGVAQYRAGNWQSAVEALEKADAMLENGDCVHRMFFAMARWQLGDKQQARELYAQGASWIAARRTESAAQIRFRAEAEQLMGITEEDRQRLVEEARARQVDQTGASPKEKPNGKPDSEQIETGDQGAKTVEREEQHAEP